MLAIVTQVRAAIGRWAASYDRWRAGNLYQVTVAAVVDSWLEGIPAESRAPLLRRNRARLYAQARAGFEAGNSHAFTAWYTTAHLTADWITTFNTAASRIEAEQDIIAMRNGSQPTSRLLLVVTGLTAAGENLVANGQLSDLDVDVVSDALVRAIIGANPADAFNAALSDKGAELVNRLLAREYRGEQ